MKSYAKNQYSGNINGWSDSEFKTLSVHALNDDAAKELNSHFGSTGVKYEETDIEPHQFGKSAEELEAENEPVVETGEVQNEVVLPADKPVV